MKKIAFLCSFFLFQCWCLAQFPVPEAFAITVNHILGEINGTGATSISFRGLPIAIYRLGGARYRQYPRYTDGL
ncbi:MAG: hypothetical protein IPH31_23755 [Lewinellaceae bacterium]|nr:hypothetical protein [Lewinellaceae bacterium]